MWFLGRFKTKSFVPLPRVRGLTHVQPAERLVSGVFFFEFFSSLVYNCGLI
jgi:hypothetical protein